MPEQKSKLDENLGPDEKLPYEPPAVVSEEVFETLALSCLTGAGPCGPIGSS